jgi:flagellar biosynthesis protein FlhA
VPEAQKEEAMMAGYTVVDPSTVIATHLTEIFRRNMFEFLGRQEVQALLDNLAKRAPKAVEELVPGCLTLGSVQKVLQNLVRESVSIRDLLSIVETLADYGYSIKDPDQLTEFVRQRLGRTIVKPFLSEEGTLALLTLDAEIEKTLQESLRQTDQGAYLALDPVVARQIIQRINAGLEQAVVTSGQPILLTSPMIRPHLAQLMLRFAPTLPVISQAEVPSDVRLENIATIGLKNAG